MPWFALPQTKTVTQSDNGIAKIAEGASSRRHAETSPVKVKDTHLMNNKLPPAEILCGDWCFFHRGTVTSPLDWYKKLGFVDLAYTFIGMKSMDMFSAYLLLGVSSHSHWSFIAVLAYILVPIWVIRFTGIGNYFRYQNFINR